MTKTVWRARAVSESGTVGDCVREEIEMFCLTHLITCIMETDVENLFIDWRFSSDEAGAPPAPPRAARFVHRHFVFWRDGSCDTTLVCNVRGVSAKNAVP